MSFRIWFLLPTANDRETDTKGSRLPILVFRRFSWVSLDSSAAIEIWRLLATESLDLETVTHGEQGPISRDGVTFDRSFINRFPHPVCVAAIRGKIICLCRSKFIKRGNLLTVSGFCIIIRCWFVSCHIRVPTVDITDSCKL